MDAETKEAVEALRDFREAMWDLYWHVFHGVSRKETLRLMMSRGLTARQAIEEMRSIEREP